MSYFSGYKIWVFFNVIFFIISVFFFQKFFNNALDLQSYNKRYLIVMHSPVSGNIVETPSDDYSEVIVKNDENLPNSKEVLSNKSYVYIVISDLGFDSEVVEKAVSMDASVSLGFSIYSNESGRLLSEAGDRDIFLSIPILPEHGDMGPLQLSSTLSKEENSKRLGALLERADGYRGLYFETLGEGVIDKSITYFVADKLRDEGLIVLHNLTDGNNTPYDFGANFFVPDVKIDCNDSLDFIKATLFDLNIKYSSKNESVKKQNQLILVRNPSVKVLSLLDDWLKASDIFEIRDLSYIPFDF